ncbi:hypothetical protein F5X96DRAFT_489437 [Biscogniauxia mediterranea]|nr:hypothetical protein F5X96DRAFT_489437 [Biscogniauxia mediterranea]
MPPSPPFFLSKCPDKHTWLRLTLPIGSYHSYYQKRGGQEYIYIYHPPSASWDKSYVTLPPPLFLFFFSSNLCAKLSLFFSWPCILLRDLRERGKEMPLCQVGRSPFREGGFLVTRSLSSHALGTPKKKYVLRMHVGYQVFSIFEVVFLLCIVRVLFPTPFLFLFIRSFFLFFR